MDYKEKYEMALEGIQEILGSGEDSIKMSRLQLRLQGIFPELKESEDERIRKAIHIYLDWLDGKKDYTPRGEYTIRDMIAWLEKQGEQKPADKVEPIEWSGKINSRNAKGVLKEMLDKKLKSADNTEPKFKVGDWIIDVQGVSANQIIGYEDDSYYIKTSCSEFYLPMKLAEKNYRLWTIQDAKDGDVLACEDGWTCIFKTLVNDENFSSYCFMDKTKWFCETGSECHTLNKEFMKAYNGEIKPATKEQRDTLERAITNAGYEWDAEKKELKKIEQKSTDEEMKEALRTEYEKGKADVIAEIQKSAWSEEDMSKVQRICKYLNEAKKYYADITEVRECIEWLKSLRPQNMWKPSEGQLECLGYAIEKAEKDWSPLINNRIYLTLKALKEQLLELKGSKV